MNEAIALIFALIGVLAAAFFAARARSASGSASQAWEENEKLAADLKSARDQLGKQSGKLSKHTEEVAELRKRLEKARRRASSAPTAPGASSSAELLEREAELEEARQARDAARQEADALGGEVRRLRIELQPKPEPEPGAEAAREEALRKEQSEAVATAEAELAKARQGEEEMRKAKSRLAKKLDTQELLYVSLRTELEAKKDRLRTQQETIERLQALEVSLGGAVDKAPAADEDPGSTTD
ncbi:MAG: hypothetical protein P8Q97_04250 [Myxococcota bacterium]|jgi:uncharacterized membrane-anchored protein YhcB (DUF1043 family)|nr:hypothetical protein [Myxococcota bacterium]